MWSLVKERKHAYPPGRQSLPNGLLARHAGRLLHKRQTDDPPWPLSVLTLALLNTIQIGASIKAVTQ